MYKKEKLLCGLIYKKTNLLTSEFVVRFLGIQILYSKVDILKSREFVYTKLFNKLLFKKHIRKQIQNNYMKYVVKTNPNYDNYIIFSSGFGEIYHFLFYLKQFIKRENISHNTLIVFKQKALKDVYELFNLNIKATVIETIAGIMLDSKQKFQNVTFYTPLSYDYFGNVEKNILNNKKHYYEMLQSNILYHLDDKSITRPNIKNSSIIQDYYKNALEECFIIISPEAATLDSIPYDFWYKLAQKLKLAGYNILINTNNPHFIIEGCISSFDKNLSVKEMFELSKYAKAIIGLRSGFLEILIENSQKLSFVVYQPFNCFAQNKMSATEVLKGFSIKKLPFINPELINEYNFESCDDYNILIDEIINKISNNDKNKDNINEIVHNIAENLNNILENKLQQAFDYNLENENFLKMYKNFYHTCCILENCSMRKVFTERLSEDFVISTIEKLHNNGANKIYLFSDLNIESDLCKQCNVDDIEDISLKDPDSYKILIAYNLDYIAKNIIDILQKHQLHYLSIEQYGTPQARYFHTNKIAHQTLMNEINNNPLTHICPMDFENIFQALEATKNLEGDYVEIGTFQGASARATLNYRDSANINKKCYFVDTYEGFTYDEAQTTQDILWTNTHTDTSVQKVQDYLSDYDNYELIKSNIIQDELPEKIKDICAVNIDVDMYEAVKSALYRVKDRVVRNGIVIAEDYGHTPALIGAQKAVDEFLEENPDIFIPIYLHSGQMFLIKK